MLFLAFALLFYLGGGGGVNFAQMVRMEAKKNHHLSKKIYAQKMGKI